MHQLPPKAKKHLHRLLKSDFNKDDLLSYDEIEARQREEPSLNVCLVSLLFHTLYKA